MPPENLSRETQTRMGLPSGFTMWSPFPFSGMNQQDSRIALEDAEFFYRENFIRIGKGNMRVCYDNGEPIYTAPTGKTIVYFFCYNIALANSIAVFLSDGTAITVNTDTGIIQTISSTMNTFYKGTQLPICSQWGSQYLLIANNITPNSYWVWNGTTFYYPGGLGPKVNITSGGAGYSVAPTVTIFGGSGTGATATATIANGSVVNVSVTNPGTGYLPGEIVQFAFSGGGADTGAILQAVLSSGNISAINLIDGGSGFTPGTYALTFTGGGGSGASGTYTVDGTGIVTSISLTSGGSGYTGTPAITFTSGGGSGATATAILSPGSVASVTVVNGGSNFTSTPSLTFEGGGGSGATAIANLTSGVITSVAVTDGGTGYTSAPAILVQTGVNNAAAATATLMPFGVSGVAMETFQQRVWLMFPNQTGGQNNGGSFLVSAPESFTDFATSDGGLIFSSSDSFLRAQYTNIKQTNGYLYPFGDSSVSVISNVQTGGAPTTTTFNYQNTDPQIGVTWRDSCQDYSRTVLFGNKFGIFGLYGGAVTKISQKMDDIFINAVFPPASGAVTPSSAVANIFNQKVYMQLMTIKDPVKDQMRNVLVSWDEKDWMILSQSTTFTFIGTQEISSNLVAWGTDGTKLVPLFNQPSSALSKRLSSKLYGAQNGYAIKTAYAFYVQGQDLSVDQKGISMSVTVDSNAPNPVDPDILPEYELPEGLTLNDSGTIQFQAIPPALPMFSIGAGGVPGVNLGFSVSSNSPDFQLTFIGLAILDTQAPTLGSTGNLTT